ncbi:MFS general substrate transporter [Aspergillus ambiguus]|uniref:MFS general substrate transporter n=1 Tax=Aspergillus ambiguus TaxID=176160 RepID=UPI003CCCC852
MSSQLNRANLPSEQTPLLGDQPVSSRPTEEPAVPLAQEPTTKELILVLGSIWVGVFLAALDTTIVATLTAPISSSFHSLSLLSWLATSYLISNAACQPLSGRLTDIFSRRAGLVFSNIFFAAGNLICGLAQTEGTIILGRVVAGIGGGGLTAISTFITSDLVPLRKRGVWQGIGNICYGAGSGLGGVFGGWINDTLGWRWAFLIQIPFVVVSGILVIFTVKIPVKVTEKSALKRVDFLGASTLVITLVLLLLGLNTGGNLVPWTHPLVLTTLPLSAVFLGLFVYVEAKIASEPVIPVRLLLDRTVASSCLTNWFSTMAVFGLLFYLPLFFQVQGLSATAAGVRLIPQAIGTSLGSLGSGILMRATGRYKIFNYIAVSIMVISSVLISTLTLTTPPWLPFIYFFLMGVAYGSMLTITLVALISAVDHGNHAVITSASYAFRSTGSTIGITIASAVFQNVLKSGLWSRLGDRKDAAEIISRLRDSLDEIGKLPMGLKDSVLNAYMDSLRAVFLTLLGLSVLGTLEVPGTVSPARRRKRLLLSTESAFVENVLSSLVENPSVELRLITDEPSALLSGSNKVPHYMDTVDSQTFEKKTGARRWLKAKAAELCEWADMLLVAPMDAGTLGSMLSGMTNTLTLALLRGWISTKPVVLIPGMTVSEWGHPLTSRQLREVDELWPWVSVVTPVLMRSNNPEELVQLPWNGLCELHETIERTLGLSFSRNLNRPSAPSESSYQPSISADKKPADTVAAAMSRNIPYWMGKMEKGARTLPVELWLNIFEDQLHDWEIAKAVGMPTNLPVPKEWQSHLLKMSTPASLEYTILRGSFAAIKKRIDSLPRWKPLSDLACHLIFKFSRTDILSYLTENHLDLWTTSRLTNLPYRASAIYGNPTILTWWRDAPSLPNKEYIADAMDGASRAGYINVLEWWRTSGLELRYTERALEAASAEGRVAVLDWWKKASASAPVSKPIPLKVGKSVLLAAQSGRAASLAWWDASGIPYSHAESVARIASTHGHVHVLDFWYRLKGAKMIFDCQVLVGPTKNGHDNVLEWWRRSGLRVEFKTCDIEEALEDADPVSGAEERVRRWWAQNGLNLGVGTSEWMKTKVL